jgi:hypothetical protein
VKRMFMVLVALLFSGTEAAPRWSVGLDMGQSSIFTGHEPGAWTGRGRSDFKAQISTLEAEAALRGPWVLGGRFMTDVEDTDYWPGSRTVRRSVTGIAYGKRILFAKGPFDLSAWGGLGYQYIATRYIKVNSKLFVPDPPVKPANEGEGSPAASLGLSQRVFYYVVGLALNESIQISADAVSLRLEVGIPLGWHKP